MNLRYLSLQIPKQTSLNRKHMAYEKFVGEAKNPAKEVASELFTIIDSIMEKYGC